MVGRVVEGAGGGGHVGWVQGVGRAELGGWCCVARCEVEIGAQRGEEGC